MTADYATRIERLRLLMAGHHDAALLSLGLDLPYFTGYEATPFERMTMAVIPSRGEVTLLVPELEAPRVVPRPDVFDLVSWADSEDPVTLVADRLRSAVPDSPRLLLSDQTWAVMMMRLLEALPGAVFTPSSALTSQLRRIKDAAEVGLLREAAAAVDRVAGRLAAHRFSGKTERELAREVAAMTVEEGSDQATFTIVASGPNGASPHHEPTDRTIKSDDVVVIDFGGKVGGYCSDTTRTFHVGSLRPEAAEIHEVVAEAQAAGRAAARVGVTAESVDGAARSIIEGAGHGDRFIHRTGHGIGLAPHEDPYLVAGNDEILQRGMAFSIEPGIYLPGRFGVRIEDIVVLGETEAESLNMSERGPIVVA